MVKRRKLFSIIIPAYNEEQRIEKTLKKFYFFFSKKYNIEIIVVCDGNTDRTPQLVSKFSKSHKKVKLLTFPVRLGKGGGILKGIKAAKGQYIGYVDADSSTSPQDYNRIFQILLTKNLDGAVASRYLKKSKIRIKQPIYRKFLSRGWNLLIRLLLGISFTDTQCGAKIFTRKALLSVIPKIKTHGFEFDVELLWRLTKKGFRIREVPTTWAHKKYSKFKLLDIVGMFFRLLEIRLFY